MANELTLGIDLGPNSIGWALINEAEHKIVDMGVRVFPEGVDNFDSSKEVSRSAARRIARGMRRQAGRRAKRKKLLRSALISADLFPADAQAQDELIKQDPYDLRKLALSEELHPHQIGRIILHINQRRGFLSNRKKERGNKEVKGMLAEISELHADLNGKTLGQYLADKAESFSHNYRVENDHIRGRHTRRDMLIDEFNTIWETQAIFHKKLLTDTLRFGHSGQPKDGIIKEYPRKPHKMKKGSDWLTEYGIAGILFFHRALKPVPIEIIGLCELEPKERRCPRADRNAQKFRMLQEVNNLRVIDPDKRIERKLTDAERTLLLDKLGQSIEMTFDAIRKALDFIESVRFNLENGKRPKLQGQPVDKLMAAKKVFDKQWWSMPDDLKDEIVTQLIDPLRDDEIIMSTAMKNWGMNEDQVESMLDAAEKFPSGYIHLSRKAIRKLIPHMERGLVYMADNEENSALHAAGYLRADQLQRRIYDKLPLPKDLKEAKLGNIPNPVVKRALVEMRKVVNAIIREYGKPTDIHVEMGRDVTTRPKKGTPGFGKYLERINDMRAREKARSQAADKLREEGIGVSRESINRYLMWEEQHHDCIYSGKHISFTQLYSGEIDVDHILPYSRCLDDSQMNKVVCFTVANHDKSNQTPYEWLAATNAEQYEQVCQRTAKLPYPKRKRFILRELILDDFISRQLNDTRYIAKATVEFLHCLYEQPHHVLGLKGQLTAELRWQWGLGTILEELPDSPAWEEQAKLRDGEKNRADHRHHAIDAIVIAMTNQSRLQQLSRIRGEGGTRTTGEILPDPWDHFRNDVIDKVKNINISHRVQRKARGQLHKDTIYGPTETPGVYVSRKPVESLSANEISSIRDPQIKKIVKARLRECGIEFGRKKKINDKDMKEAMKDLCMPSGVPIKKVRITKPEKTIQPIRENTDNVAYVKPGNTHHLCIFEFKDKKGKTERDAIFVSMLEATRRKKCWEQIIQRTPTADHPTIPPDAEFIMSLSNREMVQVQSGNDDSIEYIWTVLTAVSTEKKIIFAQHTDARKSTNKKKISKSIDKLFTDYKTCKITVDPLGRIRRAND